MKVKTKNLNFKNLLQNKIVLYVVFFLSLASIFKYITSNNCAAVLFFILLALLTNYFSKNMIVVLGSAIIGTSILDFLNIFNNSQKRFSNIEGFKEGATDDGDESVMAEEGGSDGSDGPDGPEKKDNKKDKKKDNRGDKPGNSQSKNTIISKTKSADPSPPASPPLKKKKGKGFENMGAANKLDPADIIPNIDNLLAKGDQAKSKEKAYDLLEGAIGKENIKDMAGDTQNLLKKQIELMDEMKKITPILSQTMGMVNNLDFGNLSGMFDKITNMLPTNNADE